MRGRQRTRGGEGAVAVFADVRLDTIVHIDVVLQGRDGLEAALADVAFVRPLLRVRLHMAQQQIPAIRAIFNLVVGNFVQTTYPKAM